MKILYDISVLGQGYYHSRARTGIFRVVENLALSLANSKECDLFFCVNESFKGKVLKASLDYLASKTELQNISLYPTHLMPFRRYLSNRLHELNTKIGSNSSVSKPQILHSKILKKIIYCVDEIIGYYCPDSIIPFGLLNQPNIYHSPFYPIPKQVKQVKRIKNFTTVHDLIPLLYPQFFKFNEDNLIKRVLESLDLDSWIICVSRATKNDLCSYVKHIDPTKVFVTHLAASKLFYPCHDFENINYVKKKYGIPDFSYILSLSTLEPRKNIDHIIRCFAQLVQQEKIKDLYLVLVGAKGWDYGKIFEEISKYESMQERIIFTGYVDDGELAALYSGALAFVYPSFYEGFGLPPLEAMQCGIPVITSNTSSLPEVVGDAGIVVSPTDANALCHYILEIYNKPSLRESMSLKSIEQAKQFSWEKCTQKTINAYKTALSS
jgi:glycosyltransferase involved in cell wall biosynthesis